MPEYRARYIYSVSMARRAYRSLLWEQQLVYIIASFVLFGWAIASLGSRVYAPIAGFIVGVMIMFWVSWLGGIRAAGRVASAMGSPEVELIATEEALTFLSPKAQSVIKWSGIQSLYRLPRYWFVYRGGVPSLIPVEALSEEGRDFVEKQIRGAGGRIR